MLCGIDEAGRGPVIGPMVLAGVLIDEETAEKFAAMGVKDSKMLTPGQREGLFDSIQAMAKNYHIVSIPVQEIDEALGSDDLNLNWLEAQKSGEIINKLQPDRVVVDAPGNNVDAYKEYLVKLLSPVPSTVLVEHKADQNHIECAAASILAKVTRDREIERIKKAVAKDFGSGYASDPRTQAFLEKHIEDFPDIFRKSWATYKDALSRKHQQSLQDFGGQHG